MSIIKRQANRFYWAVRNALILGMILVFCIGCSDTTVDLEQPIIPTPFSQVVTHTPDIHQTIADPTGTPTSILTPAPTVTVTPRPATGYLHGFPVHPGSGFNAFGVGDGATYQAMVEQMCYAYGITLDNSQVGALVAQGLALNGLANSVPSGVPVQLPVGLDWVSGRGYTACGFNTSSQPLFGGVILTDQGGRVLDNSITLPAGAGMPPFSLQVWGFSLPDGVQQANILHLAQIAQHGGIAVPLSGHGHHYADIFQAGLSLDDVFPADNLDLGRQALVRALTGYSSITPIILDASDGTVVWAVQLPEGAGFQPAGFFSLYRPPLLPTSTVTRVPPTQRPATAVPPTDAPEPTEKPPTQEPEPTDYWPTPTVGGG